MEVPRREKFPRDIRSGDIVVLNSGKEVLVSSPFLYEWSGIDREGRAEIYDYSSISVIIRYIRKEDDQLAFYMKKMSI